MISCNIKKDVKIIFSCVVLNLFIWNIIKWNNNFKDKHKWSIQKNRQQDEEKQNKNTKQYVLDTTMHKQCLS